MAIICAAVNMLHIWYEGRYTLEIDSYLSPGLRVLLSDDSHPPVPVPEQALSAMLLRAASSAASLQTGKIKGKMKQDKILASTIV